MDASMPSLLMRQSYVDSPSKKIESLEKVSKEIARGSNSLNHLFPSSKMGHLAKLGGKLKTWRKRWFVLKNGSLNYWKSQHDVQRKPQGQIQLDEACRINRAEGPPLSRSTRARRSTTSPRTRTPPWTTGYGCCRTCSGGMPPSCC